MRVAITGANGFIGSYLHRSWQQNGLAVLPLTRTQLDLRTPFELETTLQGVQVLVHAAGRAHVLRERHPDPLAVFRAVNVEATRRLAEQAARAGVKRFVFLSSIGVLGSRSTGRAPFNANDRPNPQEPYAQSKWEAEHTLQAVASATGLELVIVRPPLVVGPGVKGNLLRLLRLVDAGWPLPLAGVENRRSFVSLADLESLLRLVLDHPGAGGGQFLVATGEDLSTPDLLIRLAAGLGRKLRLFRLPSAWLLRGGTLVGRRAPLERLMDSLQVDASATRAHLGWQSSPSLQQPLEAMVAAYGQHGWGHHGP